MNKLQFLSIISLIFTAFKLEHSEGNSSDDLLEESISKILKICKEHLIPHKNDIKKYVDEIVQLDEVLQKKITQSISEAPGNPNGRKKRSNKEFVQPEIKAVYELKESGYVPLKQFNSTELDSLIVEVEVFIFRLKEEKIKLKNSYSGFKKTELIIKDKRTKDMAKNDTKTYETIKEYFEKKSKYYTLLFNKVVEASDMATVAYTHLIVASKILQNDKIPKPKDGIRKLEDFKKIEKAISDINAIEISPVQLITFKTNSLFIAANSITKPEKKNDTSTPPLHRSPVISILAQTMIKLVQPLNRDVNSELGTMVDLVLSTFEQIVDRDDKYDIKAVKMAKLGSKFRNFGKKFRGIIKTESDNLPDYAETTAPITDQQIYCRNDDDDEL